MNIFMSLEIVWSSECFSASRTYFRFVPNVGAHMAVESLRTEKTLAASVTNIGLFSCMKSLVIVVVGFGSESFVAKFARVWTDVFMDPHVHCKVFLLLEFFGTQLTLMGTKFRVKKHVL